MSSIRLWQVGHDPDSFPGRWERPLAWRPSQPAPDPFRGPSRNLHVEEVARFGRGRYLFPRAQRDSRWAFVLDGEGKEATPETGPDHLTTGERTYLMPESMSPPLARTPTPNRIPPPGPFPPRSPETSLHPYSKPLKRHLPARGWARGDPRSWSRT